MKNGFLHLGFLLMTAFCLFGTPSVSAAEPLVWHEKNKTFDADIATMELPDLLVQVSKLTGWEVFIEPGTSLNVSAKFKNLSRSDALRLLLGKLNFEISSRSNSIPKLFVFRTGAGNATQRIRAEKKSVVVLEKNGRIPNQLIITLEPGSKINIEVLAQQLGAKVVGKIDGLNAYLLEFPDEAAADAAREQLSKISDVASVDSNYSMEKPSPLTIASANGGSPFTLKSTAGGGDGKNVVIGLIDTSVQQLGADMEGFLLPALSVVGDSSPRGDVPTHGTLMAEFMLYGANMVQKGQETALKILPVNVFDGETTTTFHLTAGIILAANNGANVISISSGGNGESSFLNKAVTDISNTGILVFAAAGNQPVATPTFPAAYPSVIAVTAALNSKNELAPYANYGSFVDVILPGAAIVPFDGASWYANGTSVSTALASGMMAGLSEASGQPPAQLQQTFRERLRFHPPKQ